MWKSQKREKRAERISDDIMVETPKFDERHEINIQNFKDLQNKMNSKRHTLRLTKLSKDKTKNLGKQQERSDTIQGNFNLIL